jgi:hypothetical protein
MLRDEAEADAQRYAEQARGFKARQKLAYLKSGVRLTGSPLDVMDRDILTAQETMSAIRARGAGAAADRRIQAQGARGAGRAALIGGFTGAARTGLLTYAATQGFQGLRIPRNA